MRQEASGWVSEISSVCSEEPVRGFHIGHAMCTVTFCKDHSEVFEEDVTVVTQVEIMMTWTEVVVAVTVRREWGREIKGPRTDGTCGSM